MNKEDKLNVDEVMALAMIGMETGRIRKTTLADFDQIYEENPNLEGFIEKANKILDRQEVLGIKSLSVQDEEFPERLLKINDDCPAVIHILGNKELFKEPKAVAISKNTCSKEPTSNCSI